MIITIDGPAGAGKSSAARQLAKRLGFSFLDTGAMYRAVTYSAIKQGIDLSNAEDLERVANSIEIDVSDDGVLVDGLDVTSEIRTFDITTATRFAADHVGVRNRLTELQRKHSEGKNVVTEGRDQATVVFPSAECKIYLTASEEIRAERRLRDLISRGETVTFVEVLEKQRLRDQRDQSREFGRLQRTDDMIEVNTDGLTSAEVVDLLEQIARRRM